MSTLDKGLTQFLVVTEWGQCDISSLYSALMQFKRHALLVLKFSTYNFQTVHDTA